LREYTVQRMNGISLLFRVAHRMGGIFWPTFWVDGSAFSFTKGC
jgi:hypothetical protein